MFENLLDLHTHTDNSPDATHSGMVLCEYAVKKGLRGIAMTDHCEVDAYYSEHYDRIISQSFFEIRKAANVFSGDLVVGCGIELGQPSFDFNLADSILEKFDLDIVLAALHAVKGEKDFYFLDYSSYDVPSLMEKYFEELLSIAKWNNFDVLAHLTYPLRYIVGKHKINLDISKYSDLIDEILKTVANNGKAIEINTSGLRSEINEASPNLSIVKRFRELGGEYITVGSDAHKCYDIGANLREGYQIAYDAGFKSTVLFQKHLAIPISFI